MVERVVTCPDADLLVGCAEKAGIDQPPRSLAEVRTLLAAGHTLRARHVERHDSGLAALAEDFQRDFDAS